MLALRYPHFMFTLGQKAYLQLDVVAQELSDRVSHHYAVLVITGGYMGGRGL